MGPGKPGKSWNFIVPFSRKKGPPVLGSPRNQLNSTEKCECMEGSKEN